MYSFWIPQIFTNVIRDSRKPLHPHYILGMTVTRLAIPLYIFGCPNNFMRTEPDKTWCLYLGVFVGLQASILLLQHYLGSRWFIPRQVGAVVSLLFPSHIILFFPRFPTTCDTLNTMLSWGSNNLWWKSHLELYQARASDWWWHEYDICLFSPKACCDCFHLKHVENITLICLLQILPEKYFYYRRFDQESNHTTDCVICMTAIDLTRHSNDCMVYHQDSVFFPPPFL